MATQTQSMTAGEFAKAAGVSAARISKLIRDGKLKATKEGARWMISQNQLDAKVVRELKRTSKPAPAVQAVPETRPAEKTYTIAEFAAMTYLTEKGVAEWLKTGRIKGIQKETGEWRVLASNFLEPDISRLVRK
jgi:predicted site-specific integrase-resolvase